MKTTLQNLFCFKAGADDELLNTLAKLTADSPITPLAIKALSHTYVVDQIFAAHMQGRAHGFASANLIVQPNLEALSADLRAGDLAYVDYVCGLDSVQLSEQLDFEFTDGTPGRMSREEMLMHVITHGVGHRGQISALMLLNGLQPAKDGLTNYLHAQRP